MTLSPGPKTEALHHFRVVLTTPDDQERCELISTLSDRFTCVLAEIKRRFPGCSPLESWEISLPEPDEF